MKSLKQRAINDIEIAKKYASISKSEMVTSAEFAINAAEQQEARGQYASAMLWAKRSLGYSVGCFHPAYQSL